MEYIELKDKNGEGTLIPFSVGQSLINLIPENNILSETVNLGCLRGSCGKCVVEIHQGQSCINSMDLKEKITLNCKKLNTSKMRLLCKIKKETKGKIVVFIPK